MSVLICTRNRPEDIFQTLPGVMAQDYPHYEVVLVDQSTNDETEQGVQARYGEDARLRYIRTPTTGLSISRNLALTEACHEICAFTDDDTDVPPQWLSNIAATFAQYPETHILFSPVHIPPSMRHMQENGVYFPCFYFDDARVLRRGEVFGMGANMAMRKSFWQRVGPFDGMMGAGAPLPGAEEHDWLYRAHRQEAVIRLEPRNAIDHRAFRAREEWFGITRKYSYADAAFAMKHLRCGDLGLLRTVAHSLFYIGARGCLRVLQRNPGWRYEYNYVRGYWAGLWGSLKLKVDKQARLFVPVGGT